MNHPRERRTGRLFPFPVYGKWWVCLGVLILVYLTLKDGPFFNASASPIPSQQTSLAQESASLPDRQIGSAQPPPQLTAEARAEIEGLFLEVQKSSENRDELLLTLKRVLQQTFEGQEDCWSCEGTEFFDRFDKIAGSGEARKPLGFREWIDLGDEAFAKNQIDEAKRFYSQALQVIDERALDIEESLDVQAVDRARERCTQLNCR